MDADFETRLAARLREELAEAVPDDLVGPPLAGRASSGLGRTFVLPLAAAAAVAVLAVGVILARGSDGTPSAAAPTATALTGSTAQDPNIFQVPMPEPARERAQGLLSAWNGSEVTTDAEAWTGPTVWAAELTAPDRLTLNATGGALGTGRCQEQQYLSVVETSSAVVVFAQSRQSESAPPTGGSTSGIETVCLSLGYSLSLPVQLEAPLGDRAVLYLNSWEHVPLTDPGCRTERDVRCSPLKTQIS